MQDRFNVIYMLKNVFLNRNTIHTIAGQKEPLQIINRLGNCYRYKTALKVETAHAELSQEPTILKTSPSFKALWTSKTCSKLFLVKQF